jgi:hypothetical protein
VDSCKEGILVDDTIMEGIVDGCMEGITFGYHFV